MKEGSEHSGPTLRLWISETEPGGMSNRAHLSGSEVTGNNLSGAQLDIVHFDWVSVPRLHEVRQ